MKDAPHAAQVGVRRETVWRWRNDPSFASEVSVRQAQRRQSIHDELDAGVIESVRMLRGLVADTDAPPGARVRAATALMDRAGLIPAYAVEVRHKAEHAQQQIVELIQKNRQAGPQQPCGREGLVGFTYRLWLLVTVCSTLVGLPSGQAIAPKHPEKPLQHPQGRRHL